MYLSKEVHLLTKEQFQAIDKKVQEFQWDSVICCHGWFLKEARTERKHTHIHNNLYYRHRREWINTIML